VIGLSVDGGGGNERAGWTEKRERLRFSIACNKGQRVTNRRTSVNLIGAGVGDFVRRLAGGEGIVEDRTGAGAGPKQIDRGRNIRRKVEVTRKRGVKKGK